MAKRPKPRPDRFTSEAKDIHVLGKSEIRFSDFIPAGPSKPAPTEQAPKPGGGKTS